MEGPDGAHIQVPAAMSLPELIARTTPTRATQRNRKILDLARGLRFNLGMGDRPLRDLRPLVRQWHDAAAPVNRRVAFDDTWADFIHAWNRVRHPLAMDVLAAAWENSQHDPPPAAVELYDSTQVRGLVCLCAALARMSPSRRFFLSTRSAALLVNATPGRVHRWLRMLAADGVLTVIDRGSRRRAGRFRWVGSRVEAHKEGNDPVPGEAIQMGCLASRGT